LFNVVTGKIDYFKPNSLKQSSVAGLSEVRLATYFGITKKPDLIPTPKMIKVQGKPILALTPFDEASRVFKDSFRIDYLEFQKIKLERGEFERKYHQEVNKTNHEISKRVENDLKRHYENMPSFMRPKTNKPGMSGGASSGYQNRN